jgi:hypothetical protein
MRFSCNEKKPLFSCGRGIHLELLTYSWPGIPRADCIDPMNKLVDVLDRLGYKAALLKVDNTAALGRPGGYIGD